MQDHVILYRIMVDFGLVVLIWLVQLVIYPGFKYSQSSSFFDWHRKYMWLISFIVAPLMFFQLALIAYGVYSQAGLLPWISLIFAAGVWIHTFSRAVPIHNKLNVDGNSPELVQRLVRINWTRTVIWTIIWILGIVQGML